MQARLLEARVQRRVVLVLVLAMVRLSICPSLFTLHQSAKLD